MRNLLKQLLKIIIFKEKDEIDNIFILKKNSKLNSSITKELMKFILIENLVKFIQI